MKLPTSRRFFQRAALILSLWLAAFFSPASAGAQPPPADGQPQLNPRFGVVDGFANTPEASAAGAGWSRVIFRWDVIQPAGPTDWKPANVPDPLIEAELDAGREVVGVIIGTPAWATDSGTSTAVPPLEFWGDFVFKLAGQYRGRVSRWIIWNQPDVTDPASPNHTWDGSVEEYARLLKEAYLKIKTVDPSAQVHAAGLTYTWDEQQGTPQFLDRLLTVLSADPDAAANNHFFDAVGYHLYYDPARISRVLADVRAILDAHGQGGKPVWLTETNAPPSEDFIEPVQSEPPFRVTLEEQRAYVVQAFALALSGGASRVAFNKLRNERGHPESVVPFGLLRGDDSRRPAFDAFRTAATWFEGIKRAEWQRQNDLYLVTFDRGGQTTTVLWNMGRSPMNYNLTAIASQALLVTDSGDTQTISATNGVYNLQLPPAECANGDYCFIGGPPRLVIETGSPDQRGALQPQQIAPAPLPAQSPTPPPTATPDLTPTPALPPTLTPLPQPTAAEILPPTPFEPSQAVAAEPPPAVLPETPVESAPPGEASAAVPDEPVSIHSVFRPERILWLFVIGLVVFTVAYGVQLVIWSRFKR